MIELGDFLRHVRKSCKLTLRDVSSITGLTQSHIWSIEKNKASPSLETLNRLSCCYKIPVSVMVERNLNETKTSDKIMNIVLNLPDHEQEKILDVLKVLYN